MARTTDFSAVLDNNNVWTGTNEFQNTVWINYTNAEAFLVTKSSDGGDVFVIDTDTEKVSINGADTMTVNGTAITSRFAVHGEDGATEAEIEMHRHGATASAGTSIYGARSRGGVGSETVVQSGDRVLTITGVGYDGTDYATAAQIQMNVDGTPGANDMPGNIIFLTSADGGQTLAQALKLGNDKLATFAGDIEMPTFATIRSNTSDGSDNGFVRISGGGSTGTTRGAQIFAYGNESSQTGSVYLQTGAGVGGEIRFYTNSTVYQWAIDDNGHFAGQRTDSIISGLANVLVDIDADNNSGSAYFRLTKDGQATTIAELNENGIHTFPTCAGFAIGSNVVGNNPIIELGANTVSANNNEVSAIDMQFGNGTVQDYNVRIINGADNTLQFIANTFTNSVLDIDFDIMTFGGATSTIKLIPPGSSQSNPSILWENQVSTTDAAINPYQDINGTDIWIGSNYYLSSGTGTRYNTGEESAFLAVNRAGNIYFGTGGTGATATTQYSVNSSGHMLVTAGNQIQSATSSSNYLDIDTSGNVVMESRGSLTLGIDSDNTQTNAVFKIQANGSTALFTMSEDASVTHTITGTGTSYEFTTSTTNAYGLNIVASSLVGGAGLRVYSNSSSASARTLQEIFNDNASATGAVLLTLNNDAVVSTNFKITRKENGVTFYTSDGTSPNTNLSGSAGDICYNGPGGQAFYCTGTTNWTGM